MRVPDIVVVIDCIRSFINIELKNFVCDGISISSMTLIAGTIAFWKQQCGHYYMNCSNHGRQIDRCNAPGALFLGMSSTSAGVQKLLLLRQPDHVRFQPLPGAGIMLQLPLLLEELKDSVRTIQEDTVFHRWRSSSHCSIAIRVLFAAPRHDDRGTGFNGGPILRPAFEAIRPSTTPVLGKPEESDATPAVLKNCKTNATNCMIPEINIAESINDHTHLEHLYGEKTADETCIRMVVLKPTTTEILEKLQTDGEFGNYDELQQDEERLKAECKSKYFSDHYIPSVMSNDKPTNTVAAAFRSQRQQCNNSFIWMQARNCADIQIIPPPRVLIDCCWVSSQSKQQQQQQLPIVNFDIVLYHKPTLHIVSNHEELEPIMRSVGWMPWDPFEGFKEYVKLPPQGKPFQSPVEIVKLPSPLQFKSLQDFHMVQSLVLAHSSIFDIHIAFHFAH
jgi:hypothetical protein